MTKQSDTVAITFKIKILGFNSLAKQLLVVDGLVLFGPSDVPCTKVKPRGVEPEISSLSRHKNLRRHLNILYEL